MDSPEDLEARHKESLELKTSANQRYVSNEFEEAVSIYSEALDKCPFKFKEDRAIFYSNRAAAKLKMVSNIDIYNLTLPFWFDQVFVETTALITTLPMSFLHGSKTKKMELG